MACIPCIRVEADAQLEQPDKSMQLDAVLRTGCCQGERKLAGVRGNQSLTAKGKEQTARSVVIRILYEHQVTCRRTSRKYINLS